MLTALLAAQHKTVADYIDPIASAAAAGDKPALIRALKDLDERLGAPLAEEALAIGGKQLEAAYREGTADIIRKRSWRLNQADRKAMAWMEEDFVYWVGKHWGDSLSTSLKDVLVPAIDEGMSRAKMAATLEAELGAQFSRSRAYWEGLANHVTTRARNFGVTEGLVRAGATHYRINAVMDRRTSPICRAMHGRVFTVKAAVGLRDRLMAAKDPEAVKRIAPWLPAEKVMGVKTAKLPGGMAIPPLHFNCRSTMEIWESSGPVPEYGEFTKSNVGNPHHITKLIPWIKR